MKRQSSRSNILDSSVDSYANRVQHKKKRLAKVYVCGEPKRKPISVEAPEDLQVKADILRKKLQNIGLLTQMLQEKMKKNKEYKEKLKSLTRAWHMMQQTRDLSIAFSEDYLSIKKSVMPMRQAIQNTLVPDTSILIGKVASNQSTHQNQIEVIRRRIRGVQEKLEQRQSYRTSLQNTLAKHKQTFKSVNQNRQKLQAQKLMNIHQLLILREQILVIRNKPREYDYEANPKDQFFNIPELTLRQKAVMDFTFFLASYTVPDIRTILQKNSYFSQSLAPIYPVSLLERSLGIEQVSKSTIEGLQIKASTKPFTKEFKIGVSEHLAEYIFEAVAIICQLSQWKLLSMPTENHPTFSLSNGQSNLNLHLELGGSLSLRIQSISNQTAPSS